MRGTKKNKSCLFEPPQGQFIYFQPITLFQLPDVWPWHCETKCLKSSICKRCGEGLRPHQTHLHQSHQMC